MDWFRIRWAAYWGHWIPAECYILGRCFSDHKAVWWWIVICMPVSYYQVYMWTTVLRALIVTVSALSCTVCTLGSLLNKTVSTALSTVLNLWLELYQHTTDFWFNSDDVTVTLSCEVWELPSTFIPRATILSPHVPDDPVPPEENTLLSRMIWFPLFWQLNAVPFHKVVPNPTVVQLKISTVLEQAHRSLSGTMNLEKNINNKTSCCHSSEHCQHV